jgi:hypothetical protein
MPMNFLRKYSEEIFGIGIAVMLLGVAIFALAESQFGSLRNFQRTAMFIPMCFGGFLMSIGTFVSWGTASSYAKHRSVGLTLVFIMVVLGTLAWWLLAPDARS